MSDKATGPSPARAAYARITAAHRERLGGGELLARTPRLEWAKLLRRTFACDVLVCPRCSGPARVLAAIHEPSEARRFLDALDQRSTPTTLPPSRVGHDGDLDDDCDDDLVSRDDYLSDESGPASDDLEPPPPSSDERPPPSSRPEAPPPDTRDPRAPRAESPAAARPPPGGRRLRSFTRANLAFREASRPSSLYCVERTIWKLGSWNPPRTLRSPTPRFGLLPPVLDQIDAGRRGIILMHATKRTTANAIGPIIDGIRARGLTIRSVESFVRSKYGQSSYSLMMAAR